MIAFDVDGVLADFVGAIRAGLNLPADWQPRQWDIALDPLLKGRKEELYALYAKPGLAASLAVYDGAGEVVRALDAMRYRLAFATSPMKSNKTWVHERASWTYTKIIAGLTTYSTADKLTCPAYVLIDDKPEHVRAYRDSGRVGILLDRPWNQEEHDVPRARDLRDAAVMATYAVNQKRNEHVRVAMTYDIESDSIFRPEV